MIRIFNPLKSTVTSRLPYISLRYLTQSDLPEDATFDDVQKNIKTKKSMLIDVRTPEEFYDGAVPGAHHIELRYFGPYIILPPKEFEEKTGFPKPKENADVIVMCLKGLRSRTAQLAMIAAGYKNVRSYTGSYTEWIEKNGEVIIPEQKEEN